MKKIFSTVIILLVISFASTIYPTSSHAEEKESAIEFVLHKKMFKDFNATPDYTQNTGLEMDSNAEETYGLNNVTFEVYEVTDWAAEELQTQSLENLMTKVMNTPMQELRGKFSSDVKNPLLQEVVTTTIANEDGVAVVNVTPAIHNSAYLFLETKAPAIEGQEIRELAAPMLVVLPIENPSVSGSYLSTIHLYPKNSGVELPKPPEPQKPEQPKPEKPSKPGKPSLPITGEAKSMISILGIALLITAFLLYRKQVNNQMK